MKTICIYHSRDLDGWMSAAIVKKHYLDNGGKEDTIAGLVLNNIPFESDELINDGKFYPMKRRHNLWFFGWDYGDTIPDLSGYDRIIMCDVAFDPKEMKLLHKRLISTKGYVGKGREKQPSDFIWIDHHSSAIKAMEDEYPIGDSIPISLPFGLRNEKFAACELTWQYFFPDDPMPEIVRLLGMYDSFRHKNTDEEQKVLEFQYAARARMSDYNECFGYLISQSSSFDGALGKEKVMVGLRNAGKDIYKYLCTEAKQTYAKAFPIKFIEPHEDNGGGRERLFLCVNQERFNPINFGIDYHKQGYDGFACFWLKDGKWNWSLYNDNGEVDCSAICKQYGGGGHKGAAGFVCEFDELSRILNK